LSDQRPNPQPVSNQPHGKRNRRRARVGGPGAPTGRRQTPVTRPAGTAKVRASKPTARTGGIPWAPLLGIVGVIAVVVVGVVLLMKPGATSPAGGVLNATCPTSQPPALAAGQTRTVTMGTEKGTITIKLEADLSPIAVGNFAALVSCGYYDGLGFHRVVPQFVIQGGRGPKLAYTIEDEPVTATYGRGVVAMARTSQPHSVDSQFFIVTDDLARTALASANTYQIIGHVTSGMEVADAITAAADKELPSNPIKMTTVTIANP
jgi:cyclophilin family peptidyl-prolyl cis-trans isomerase